ncbi:MAG: hypothetical protein FJ087_06835 [Deltaproteobacteria bacterium]|nr:hypothetical protein [Deltaproteobacteria bacterium]
MTRAIAFVAGVLLAAGVAGCGLAGGGDDSGPGGDPGGSNHPEFSPLYSQYFNRCRSCHSPDGPMRPVGQPIESTLDFTTVDTAWSTIRSGEATGLQGSNAEACNGVPFVAGTYAGSLIAAVVDPDVRGSFSTGSGCDGDAVGDMTLKVGATPSDAFLNGLKTWIENGAP